MKKVALVGIGGMGGCHFNCYKNIETAQVVAVCDVRVDMAKEKVADESVRIYADYDEMLANEKVDIIDICTPSYLHREMSVKALEKGFHVLCEKPMSLSSEDCEAVIAAAKKADRFFMTAHVVRFMNNYIYLKSVIDSCELGKLVRLDMKRLSSIPRWSWDDWMRDVKRSGGTPFDLSIHDLDFIQYVLGQPKDVHGTYYKMKNDDDFIVSELVYDNCAVSAEGSWHNYDIPFKAQFRAIFEHGSLEFDGETIRKNGEIVELEKGEISADTGINLSNADGYAAEIRYFIDCVEKGVQPQAVTPESSTASVKLVERILDNAIVL